MCAVAGIEYLCRCEVFKYGPGSYSRFGVSYYYDVLDVQIQSYDTAKRLKNLPNANIPHDNLKLSKNDLHD